MTDRFLFPIAASATILLLVNLFLLKFSALGIIGMAAYLASVSILIGSRMQNEPGTAHLVVGFLTLLSVIILVHTGSYYLFGVSEFTSAITLVLPFGFLFLDAKTPIAKTPVAKKIAPRPRRVPYLFIGLVALEIGLIGLLIGNQTTGLLRSPWHALEPMFFAAYALATGLLFYIIQTTKRDSVAILFSCIHFFVTFSVAAILYPLGFGFDAFVHRATEEWIVRYGVIDPKTPYYIGQYALVAFFTHLTRLPVFFIDVYLVPALAALMLPAGTGIFLKKIWQIPFRRGLVLAWLIPFVPFLNAYLHLTTPFNLAFLLAIFAVFATLAYMRHTLPVLIPLLLGASALASHPLVGAPLCVIIVGACIIIAWGEKKKNSILPIIIATGCCGAAVIPILFAARNAALGLGLPTLAASPLAHFLALFERPYWYAQHAPVIFELLYTSSRGIVPIVILLALVGLFVIKKRRFISLFFLTAASSVFLSAWLLRSSIIFPDVAAYEQGDFPLRLIKLSLVFLLPFAMYALHKIMENISLKRILYITCAVFATLFLTLSLYLSYPQHNPKARFPGLNVTATDVEAVRRIHNRHEAYDYIVLANQLVSAAALTEYSFAQYIPTEQGEIFYYSIPTGGPLYTQYGRMLYEGQKREYMETAMDLAGVDTAYFVLNTYWAHAPAIIDGAKKTADSWETIDDDVWIFTYTR